MVAESRAGAGAEAEAEVGLRDHESQPRSQSPSLQMRLFPFLSLANRRSYGEPTSRPESPESGLSASDSKRSSFMAEQGRPSSLANRHRAVSDSTRHRDATVRFGDVAHFTIPSDDEESLVSSELSDQAHADGTHKRRKSTPRKSTRFALAYPAPQLLTKQRSLVQIRPRLLLQLQELGQKRAMPAFDVVPSTLIAGTLIIPKLSKKLPRMFRMKPHMNQNDLLLVRSEHHRQNSSLTESSDENEHGLDDQDVLAVISTSPEQDDNCVEIVFPDGSVWTTSLMANGSYEFTKINHHGEIVKARWVKKTLAGHANTHSDATCTSPAHRPQSPSALPEHKWTFSIIDPSTRKHPIQGVLTQTTIDIFDTCSTLSASSSNHSPTLHSGSESQDRSATPPSVVEERTRMEVTEDNKKLMLATATWISLRQKGWPWYAAPKFAKAMSSSITTPTSGSTHARSRPSSPVYADLDASIPIISSSDTFAPPASAPQVKQKSLRRAVSSGGEHARKRREASELADLEEAEEEKSKHKAQQDGAPTCRLRLRRFTHKLFHPKSQLVS